MKILVSVISILFLTVSFLMAKDQGHANVKPSHGGEILEVGAHIAHIEVVHHEKMGIIVLYTMDANGKVMSISDAPRLNLTFKVNKSEKRKQVIAKAMNLKDGKSSMFEAQDMIFKSDDFDGVVSIKINGKTYRVALHHNHGGHNDHDDHEGHDH